MLLAIDIGNTNIVFGAYENGKWVHQWRLETVPEKGVEEYRQLVDELLEDGQMSYGDYSRIIIGSVVPSLTDVISHIFKRGTGHQPLILDSSVDTGISLDTADPSSVGADLIADAAGAYHRFKATCIIVDFGTATTIMAVKEPGVLAGGAICAGLKVTRDALVEKTALLPSIPLELPANIIGTDTVEAMQSGIVAGHLCMVEGLVKRMKQALGDMDTKVLATGGFASTLAAHTDCFDAVDSLLTLNGLRMIAERQAPG